MPSEFEGHQTRFVSPDDAHARPEPQRAVRVLTPQEFFRSYLGFDLASEITPRDWLTFASQELRSIACGPIYHDDIALEATRARFAWYPTDVWLYLLASAWTRIGQEEHLMGRAGIVGDEIGSSLIGGRLVRDLMRLCFLMERQFAPYPKWFGSAFQQLRCAPRLTSNLTAALHASTWQDREQSLATAYELVGEMHNALAITPPMPSTTQQFFTRPFRVIALAGFETAIVEQIRDESVRALLRRPLIGAIDQFSDSTDLVSNPVFRPAIRALYIA